MPVNKLLVEGKHDAEILGIILAGVTTIESGKCSKDALAPRTRTERASGRNTFYLRDRDYDFSPPEDLSKPTEDRWEDEHRQSLLGWRWCRHSLECYLLDPMIVNAATGINRDEYVAALSAAARRIRYYQAARWVIGTARRALPPTYELQTHPLECGTKEFYLPDDLGEEYSLNWMHSHSSRFLKNVQETLNENAMERSFTEKTSTFTDEMLASTERILLWFSGKDLITAMQDCPIIKDLGLPGDFRGILADWIRKYPEKTLEFLPEWMLFKEIIAR